MFRRLFVIVRAQNYGFFSFSLFLALPLHDKVQNSLLLEMVLDVLASGRWTMKEDRSPCLQCERVNKSKNQCCGSCEELDNYKDGLPYFSLWREDPVCYVIPGLERTRTYSSAE